MPEYRVTTDEGFVCGYHGRIMLARCQRRSLLSVWPEACFSIERLTKFGWIVVIPLW
jgi:hypothetical protein